jgi:nicotinate-nucleotide adenylyltransferase
MPESLGVMGGTFDPIHLGHLLAAEEARQRFHIERVVFIPNREPPHKRDYAVTSPEHRYAMTVLATAGNPHFEASRMEIDRPGPSYTVDTMRAFREELGAEARLYFITGADAIIETVTWRRPEEIAALCEFVAVTRPGYPLERLSEAELAPGTRIHVLHMPGLEISSTEIRRRVAAGESVRYLVPPPVARYIETNRLYTTRGGVRAACGPG